MPRLGLVTAGVAFAILASGCGPAADDPVRAGVGPDEAQALNDAASMLGNGDDAVVVTNADEGAGNVE